MTRAPKVPLKLRDAMQRLVSRLLSGEAKVLLSIEKDEQGGQAIVCTWEAAGWRGELKLDRPGAREITGADLGAVLTFLDDQLEAGA